jgi:hypothetical protein
VKPLALVCSKEQQRTSCHLIKITQEYSAILGAIATCCMFLVLITVSIAVECFIVTRRSIIAASPMAAPGKNLARAS